MELYGALFLIFTFLAIVFRYVARCAVSPYDGPTLRSSPSSSPRSPLCPTRSGICQLETEPAEITHEEEAIASAAASPRTPRRSRETTTVLSDSEDEVTFSTKKRSTKVRQSWRPSLPLSLVKRIIP